MDTFISEVAQKLITEHPNDLDRIVVIFNNRRSGIFLRQQLASYNKPFFLPRIIGIDELIADLGGLSIVPNEYLLFELFEIHCQLNIDNKKYSDFENFISIGDMMLSDFSEIDLYCVDAQQLFSNLHDIKSIGEWDIESGKLSSFQEKYLAFYKSLYQYYSQLHNRLLLKHQAYSGMAYRHVAENINSLMSSTDDSFYYFVGFNAISTSENIIIRHYLRQGNCKILTDGDAYYFNNPDQEAGHFLRRHQESRLFPRTDYPDHFSLGHKVITVVSCPENVLQCKYTGQLIARQASDTPERPFDQTAIVLADESLLLPTLNSLPPEVKTTNITMGYPFSHTDIHATVITLFSLHQRRRQKMFYHQDILNALAYKCISNIHGISNLHSKLSEMFSSQRIIYTSFDELCDICMSIGCDISPLSFLFPPEPPTTDEFLNLLKHFIQQVYNSDNHNIDQKEKEALGVLLQIVNYFQDFQKKYHFVSSLNVLLKIYSRIAQRSTVPFYGEPLQGLQILGVLETRNLDFKKVILLSANEGTLPSGKSHNTLIPYNLKVAFGMPTFHDKDVVYAYNFYRLLQRADEIHLLYHTETDGIGKGEPSRFLLQVRRELALKYPDNITLLEEVLSANQQTQPVQNIQKYTKTPSVIKRLHQIAQQGFSPSALNKYRNCPLKFYFENILNINEKESISEDMEQNELGDCIHSVLETIYAPTVGLLLQRDTLLYALDNIDQLINQALDPQFLHGRSHTGRNHLLKSVAKTQISNFLNTEIRDLDKGSQIRILSLEKKLSHTIQINVDDTPYNITIMGIADRIDSYNNLTRIIDYKSGKVESADLNVRISDSDWTTLPDKWFQVLLYTWLFHHTSHSAGPYISGIYPLRHLNSDFLPAQWQGVSTFTASHLDNFEVMLKDLLSNAFDPHNDFISNTKSKMCSFCPFAETCQRQSL